MEEELKIKIINYYNKTYGVAVVSITMLEGNNVKIEYRNRTMEVIVPNRIYRQHSSVVLSYEELIELVKEGGY